MNHDCCEPQECCTPRDKKGPSGGGRRDSDAILTWNMPVIIPQATPVTLYAPPSAPAPLTGLNPPYAGVLADRQGSIRNLRIEHYGGASEAAQITYTIMVDRGLGYFDTALTLNIDPGDGGDTLLLGVEIKPQERIILKIDAPALVAPPVYFTASLTLRGFIP